MKNVIETVLHLFEWPKWINVCIWWYDFFNKNHFLLEIGHRGMLGFKHCGLTPLVWTFLRKTMQWNNMHGLRNCPLSPVKISNTPRENMASIVKIAKKYRFVSFSFFIIWCKQEYYRFDSLKNILNTAKQKKFSQSIKLGEVFQWVRCHH